MNYFNRAKTEAGLIRVSEMQDKEKIRFMAYQEREFKSEMTPIQIEAESNFMKCMLKLWREFQNTKRDMKLRITSEGIQIISEPQQKRLDAIQDRGVKLMRHWEAFYIRERLVR
jgi:hypothetical protein